jgi:hypothetical protein
MDTVHRGARLAKEAAGESSAEHSVDCVIIY